MRKLILLVIIFVANGMEVCGSCNFSKIKTVEPEFQQIVSLANATKKLIDSMTQEAIIIKASPTNNSNVGIIFKNLTATCRRYVDVLAYKDQLQKQMFNNATRQSNATLTLLTSLIITLQTAAMKLQQIEIKMAESYCITFTSEQYEVIYLSRLHSTEVDLLSSLYNRALGKWADFVDPCRKWENYD